MSASTPPQCYTINNSSILPELNGFQIVQNQNPKTKLVNQAMLEDYARKLKGSNIGVSLSCKGSDGSEKLRYFASTFLTLTYIDYSVKSCPNTNPPPRLCRKVVEEASRTFQDFSTANDCAADNKNIIKLRSAIDRFLANDSNTDQECLLGIGQDKILCGFETKDGAVQHCQSKPEDGCCALVARETGAGISYLVIGLAVAGSLLLLIAMVFFFRRYIRQQRQRETSSEDGKSTTFKVIQTYSPQLIDEIQLNIGDVVIVKETFDDGWGSGLNITTESEGSFPLNCLGNLKSVDSNKLEMETMRSTRDSSLSKNSFPEEDDDEDLLFQSVIIAPTEEAKENKPNDPSVEQKEDDSVNAPEPWIENIYSAFKGRQKDSRKAPENELQDSSTIKVRDSDIYSTIKVRDRDSDIYSTVKIGNPESNHLDSDIYSTVKIGNPESNQGTIRLPPKPNANVGNFATLNSNSSVFNAKNGPSTSKSERSLGTKLSPIITENLSRPSNKSPIRVGKSPRKFGNDDFKYGTIKSSTANSPKLSPIRPSVTTTFNQIPK